jgi:hypothetical protein
MMLALGLVQFLFGCQSRCLQDIAKVARDCSHVLHRTWEARDFRTPRVVVDVVLDVASAAKSAARLLGLHVLMPSVEFLTFGLKVSLSYLKALHLLLEIGSPTTRG